MFFEDGTYPLPLTLPCFHQSVACAYGSGEAIMGIYRGDCHYRILLVNLEIGGWCNQQRVTRLYHFFQNSLYLTLEIHV